MARVRYMACIGKSTQPIYIHVRINKNLKVIQVNLFLQLMCQVSIIRLSSNVPTTLILNLTGILVQSFLRSLKMKSVDADPVDGSKICNKNKFFPLKISFYNSNVFMSKVKKFNFCYKIYSFGKITINIYGTHLQMLTTSLTLHNSLFH